MKTITRISPSSVFKYATVPDEVSGIEYSPKEKALAFFCFSTGEVGFVSASNFRCVPRRREVTNPMGIGCDSKGIVLFQYATGLVWQFNQSLSGGSSLSARKAFMDFESCISFGNKEDSVPVGVAMVGYDTAAVAVKAANRIVGISPSGSRVMMGNGKRGFSFSNDLLASMLNEPSDLCFDPSGTIWVADAGNGVLRRLTPNKEELPIGMPGDLRQVDGEITKARFLRPTSIGFCDRKVAVVDAGTVRLVDLTAGTVSTIYMTSRKVIDVANSPSGVFVLEES